MIRGGVGLPWNLALCALIGLALLFTRVTLDADGSLANAHHIVGALVLTVVAIAAAEVARPLRYLNIALGVALTLVPFIYDVTTLQAAVTVLSGIALALLSLRRGPIHERYGPWSRRIA